MISTQTNSPSVSTVSPSSEKSPATQTNDNSNPQQGSGRGIMSTAEQASGGDGPPSDNAAKGAGARMGPMKYPPSKKDSRKLFVGGLPADGTWMILKSLFLTKWASHACFVSLFVVTEMEFREFFEQFGVVVDSVVMFDRETQRSRGFGFVTFHDPVSLSSLWVFE